MLTGGRNVLGQAWWISVFPGAAITLTVIAATVVGRALAPAGSRRTHAMGGGAAWTDCRSRSGSPRSSTASISAVAPGDASRSSGSPAREVAHGSRARSGSLPGRRHVRAAELRSTADECARGRTGAGAPARARGSLSSRRTRSSRSTRSAGSGRGRRAAAPTRGDGCRAPPARPRRELLDNVAIPDPRARPPVPARTVRRPPPARPHRVGARGRARGPHRRRAHHRHSMPPSRLRSCGCSADRRPRQPPSC